MQLDSAFDVTAPIDQVWSTLMDFERVAACLPGAQVLNTLSEDAYQVGMKVKLGPVTMQYKGQLDVVERHPDEHRAVLRGKAKEARGQGTAEATAQLALTSDGTTTHGTVTADVNLSGRAAAMGQGVINTVTEQMMTQFAKNLQAMLAAGDAPEATSPAGSAPSDTAAAADPGPDRTARSDADAPAAPAAPAKKAAPRKRAAAKAAAGADVTTANGTAVTTPVSADGAPAPAPAAETPGGQALDAKTPSTKTPGTKTPSGKTPSGKTPSTGTPSTGTPGAEIAGDVTPAAASGPIAADGAPAPAPTAPSAAPASGAAAPPAAAADAGARPAVTRQAPAFQPADDDNALDALVLARAIAEAQLKEPKKVLGLLAIVAFLAYLFGKRRGRKAAG